MGKPNGALSKSDMPIDRRPHHEIMQDFFNSGPCLHFHVNTRVTCKGQGGLVERESLDGGQSLVVRWDDGTKSVIPNPNYRSNP